jgi:zinc protease
LRPLIAVLLTLLAAGAVAQAPPPSPEARTAWGFDRSDLPPDPAIRFGLLANGMRYAILRTGAPAGRASLRLQVAFGAAMAGPGEAHYLEHMLFEGSRRVPEGATRRLIRREGLRLGRGFNAATGDTDTLFRIDLRRSGEAAVDRNLLLLRDMASEASILPAAVARVRAEVAHQARTESDPAERDRIAFFLPGTSLARAALIGDESTTAGVRAEALRALYQRFYVPARAVLVVVGDVDPAWVERRIEAQFGDWRAGAATPSRPPDRVDPARPTAFRHFRARGAPTSVTIAAITPREAGDSAARRDRAFLQSIAADMLEARITGYRGGDRAFMDAAARVQEYYRTARIAELVVTPFDGDWRAALETGERELRRALLHGFTQAELDIALLRERERLDEVARGTTSAEVADRIVALVSAGIVPTAPGDPASTVAYVGRIRLDAVNAAFRAAWGPPQRLVHVAHAGPIEGGDVRLAEVWAASAAQPVAPPQ